MNNVIELRPGELKRLINPSLGFKSIKTASATIKGFEVMLIFRKGILEFWKYGQGIQGEIRIIRDKLLAFLKNPIVFLATI